MYKSKEKKEQKDNINNWYKILGQGSSTQKLDKNYKKHMIQPNSRILVIGPSGSGKTNFVMDFLSRKNESFYKIIIFSASTTDEPLYQKLKDSCDEGYVDLYSDIKQLPDLQTFDDEDKGLEKLIIIDDFCNLKNKEMSKLNDYAIASRKMGFTCIFLAQNYTSVPKIISRNCNYFILFKLHDLTSIKNIIKNHNLDDKEPSEIMDMYKESTNQPLNFFMIDTKGPEKIRYRHNFLDFF